VVRRGRRLRGIAPRPAPGVEHGSVRVRCLRVLAPRHLAAQQGEGHPVRAGHHAEGSALPRGRCRPMRPAGLQRPSRPQDERVCPCHRRGSGRGGGGCVDVPRCRTGQGCAQRDRVPGHCGRDPHTRRNGRRLHGTRHAAGSVVDHRSGEGGIIRPTPLTFTPHRGTIPP